MAQLLDKRCLIIGGTSGLGLAAARGFVQEGARVVVAGLPSDDPCGLPTPAMSCDVSKPAEVELLFRDTLRCLGGLDIVYHVAGSSGRRHGDGSLHACTDDGWDYTVNANLKSVFLTTRAAVQHFLAVKQPGVILVLSSILALSPAPHFFDTCAYTAAKGGIVALCRQAAARYAPDGIRVNVLAPGLMDTPMAQRAVQNPAIRAYLRSKQPLANGPGSAEDGVGAAVFLCSDAARFITGIVLPVDGGWGISEGQYGELMKDALQ